MSHSIVGLSIALLTVGFTLYSTSTVQENTKIVIPLKINHEVEQFSGQIIASRRTGEPLTYTSPAGSGFGFAPGRVLFRFEEVEGSQHAYRFRIDSNRDGNPLNDAAQLLAPNSSVLIRVTRLRATGISEPLPYSLRYSREPDPKGQVREHFLWLPHYRAEGRMRIKNCESLLSVLDLTSDGQFDAEDFFAGTSIGLDRNGDGRIWGREEYLKGEQILEYCGENFLIENVAADGSSVTLVRTSLRVPKLGEVLPEFTVTTIDGKTIESKNLRDKVHLLDFWASWCKPCVEKFGVVKQLARDFETDVTVIAVNVDEDAQLAHARQIIQDYSLSWPHVMNGRGESDILWKMFGGMEGNRLSIPLYVIADAQGQLRYAGNGGEDLSDLRALIRKLVDKSQ